MANILQSKIWKETYVIFINPTVNFIGISLLGRKQHDVGLIYWVSLNFTVQDEKVGI